MDRKQTVCVSAFCLPLSGLDIFTSYSISVCVAMVCLCGCTDFLWDESAPTVYWQAAVVRLRSRDQMDDNNTHLLVSRDRLQGSGTAG